jgi:hypothetical protein
MLLRLLGAFCILTAVAWIASLVVLGVDQILVSQRLHAIGPIALGLGFLAVEICGALFVQWRIRRAPEWLSSAWTLAAVVAALCLGLMNVLVGMAVG